METTNIALIGCGFFAANHLHAWNGLAPEARIVAVCDLDAEKAKAAADTFGVPAWYTDATAMLDAEAIDLVDIATQMRSHRPLAELTLGRGVATIVQKPFAPTLADAVAIRDAASGTFCAVHENFRFQPVMRRIAEVLAAGEIGPTTWARIAFRTGYDVYATQPYFYEEERFAILDVGIHVLDLVRVFMGEVDHLSCEAQRRNPKVRAEDTATMLIRHASGAVSVVEHTYESRREPDPFPDTRILIEGDRGAIAYDANDVLEITVDGSVRRETVTPPLAPWMEERWRIAHLSVPATCAHILERFRAGKPADTSADDNLKTFALVEAAYRSAASGRAEKPPETD